MAPNVKRFCSLLARSRLLGRDDLTQAYRGWRDSAPDQRENLPAFIKYLVAHTPVKSAQVEQLLQSGAATADGTDAALEVELISVRDPEPGLTRRDLVMLLSGAAAGAAAIVVPALFLRRSDGPAEK